MGFCRAARAKEIGSLRSARHGVSTRCDDAVCERYITTLMRTLNYTHAIRHRPAATPQAPMRVKPLKNQKVSHGTHRMSIYTELARLLGPAPQAPSLRRNTVTGHALRARLGPRPNAIRDQRGPRRAG
eukprot:1953759-Pyramimonas_sp.AAC.1